MKRSLRACFLASGEIATGDSDLSESVVTIHGRMNTK